MNSIGRALATVRPQSSFFAVAEAWLRLLRPANLVTAAADSITGCAVVGALHNTSLGWRVGASICLYAGGVMLNDFFDRRLDSIERPERPIPSGLVSGGAAAAVGFALLGAGIAAAFQASTMTGGIAVAIALLVLAYDAILKHSDFGPIVMGSCRALNLMIGLAAAPALLPKLGWLGILPLAYIAAFTLLSRGEVLGGSRRSGAASLVVFGAIVAALVTMNSSAPRLLRLLPFVALLCVRVLPPLWRAYRVPHAGTVRAAVHAGIVSLVLFDSALAAGFAGAVAGAEIVALAAVAMLLGRLFPVT